MNTLEADSILISFGGRPILTDIYLRCQTEEIVGIVGRNGCGKSTLMKILFGSLRGENQSVRVNGTYHQIPFETSGTINYLTQDTFLPDAISVAYARKMFGIAAPFEETMSIDHMKFGELSKGQRRFIETLIILYSPTQFSLFDEPFSYVSPIMTEQLLPHFQKQKKKKGIILADHSYETVFNLCSRFYFLNDGILRSVQDKGELQEVGYLPE